MLEQNRVRDRQGASLGAGRGGNLEGTIWGLPSALGCCWKGETIKTGTATTGGWIWGGYGCEEHPRALSGVSSGNWGNQGTAELWGLGISRRSSGDVPDLGPHGMEVPLSAGAGEQHRQVDPRPGKQEQPLPEGADAWGGLGTLREMAWGTEHRANEEVRRLSGLSKGRETFSQGCCWTSEGENL